MSSHRDDAGLRPCDFAMSLDEIGQQLGVSRERVRQLERRALHKARVILGRRGYTWEDFLRAERHD